MWKFKLTLPKPGQSVACRLEIRQKGKAPRRAGGAIVGPFNDSSAEVFVGLQPLGDSWSKSDKFKSYVRIGPNNGKSTEKNPFKGCTELALGDSRLLSDGSLLLMSGNPKPNGWPPGAETDDIALVLKMQPENRKYPT